jgi:hypothetical protein
MQLDKLRFDRRLHRALTVWRTERDYLRAARAEAALATRDERIRPILIYQMGKVASSSVYESLRKVVDRPVVHLHFLSDTIDKHFAQHRNAGVRPLPYHLFLGKALRKCLTSSRVRVQVITLVRDPIARQLSDLFQNPQFHDYGDALQNCRPEDLTARFIADIDRGDSLNYMFDWLDSEIRSVFGVDVFATDFDRQRGWQRYASDTAEVFLARVENLDQAFACGLPDFLGIPGPIEQVKANIRHETPAGELYGAMKNALALPDNVLRRVYSHCFCRHFYTDAELEQFIAKWRGLRV